MVLELSKTFTHSCGTHQNAEYSDQDLQELMMKWMERNGIDPGLAKISEDGVLQIEETPDLKLHSFILQAEEMGLKMKYTKKTLIEIC